MKLPFFHLCLLLFIICLPASAAAPPQPAWGTNGLLVNDAAGNTPQQKPRIQADGKGNYFIVWEDSRTGYVDIYAQKINAAGKPLWAAGGLPVCQAGRNQNFPQIITDNAGGVIIVWQDYRNGQADIFAQRLDASGAELWQKDGVPVCAAPAGQFAPEICPDNSGGTLITWHDYRSNLGEDIYAQRLNQQGKAVWAVNGIPVCAANGTQWYPKIAPDGLGGAVIAWTDGRISSSDNNVYAQRIDPAGQLVWAKDGVPVCVAAANQERPVIIAAAGGAIVAWNDYRNGNSDIFAQKITLDAELVWPENGVAVCQQPYAQENPQLCEDGDGGALVVWSDLRAEDSSIYAQRIQQNGSQAWQENGRLLSAPEGQQKNPLLASLNNKEWLVVWEDSRKGQAALVAQKINISSTLLWPGGGLYLAAQKQPQTAPAVAVSPAGEALIVWEDSRQGNTDIYGQKVSAAGSLLWAETGLSICSEPGSVVQQNLRLLTNSAGEVILAFEDARSGFLNIYCQKISADGALAWGADGVAAAKIAANQANVRLVDDGAGGAIIAWEDQRVKKAPVIRAQRLNSKGAPVWFGSIVVSQTTAAQENLRLVSDGAGGAIIAWEDSRDVLSQREIFAQRISGAGNLLWGSSGKAVVSANGDQVDLDLIPDGASGAFLVWTDYRKGDRNPDIYGQRIDGHGDSLWQEGGVMICGAPDIQRIPRVISDDEGGLFVVWTDKGGGSYDIYAQRLSKAGQPLWMTDGIPVNQLSRTQQNPGFGGNNIIVWEDYRYGNWDIFAAALEPGGRLRWSEEGVPVALVSHTQYAPKVAPWKNGSVVAAWEDYRSGEQYEIYIQKIDPGGRGAWQENGVRVMSRNGAKAPSLISNIAQNCFYVFWEDFTGGGRALYGQKYLVE